MLNWWLTTAAIRFLPLFIPLTLALLYEFTVLPSIFLYFVIKAKKPERKIAPKNKKVAVISLCVPSSESLDIVENQLKAMAAITYKHDSWILDEGNNPGIKRMAKKYGVKHFSRQGIKKYNQPEPPFKEKTKAGNVNAWLDHVKNRKYEFFVQLDIDHIPKPNYLHKTLGYFKDPLVAWVQAPSVYGNLDSWTARGAAERELVLQGPLQMGFYGHSQTPFIIGSHSTYRMSAINEIGGFQPTRAEDHLDTVYLAHNGYKGVFLPEIIAVGDGPETLNTYLAQQFAWAYSMFQVLLMHTPKLLKSMPGKRKWQFLFAQTWYPLWSLSYLTMFLTPIIALVLNHNVASVKPESMLLHFIPLYACGFLVWLSARPIMQPRNLSLSWRGIILHAITWPIILRAIIAALFKVKKPYMITPKGSYAKSAPTLLTYRPFLFFGLLSAGSIIVTSLLRHGHIPLAQTVFAITNSAFMLAICLIDIILRARQARPKLRVIKDLWIKPVLATAGLMIVFGLSLITVALPLTNQQTFAETPQPTYEVHQKRLANYDMSTAELIEQIKLVPKRADDSTPNLGMYSPTEVAVTSGNPYIQHSFADWRDDHYFALVLAQTLQSGNVPLITVEPRGEADGAKLLADINAGVYDSRLANLAKVIRASKNPVYIRFGHEMELVQLYPWGGQQPESYVSAYRHTIDYFRSHGAGNVRSVWSPAGNRGVAEAYYPGDSYVDVIGTTILYDQYWYKNRLPSFNKLASGREWLEQYNKPVWIVEFGAGRANLNDQTTLINEAKAQYAGDGFKALIYLNIVDANISGPDYRLDSTQSFGL